VSLQFPSKTPSNQRKQRMVRLQHRPRGRNTLLLIRQPRLLTAHNNQQQRRPLHQRNKHPAIHAPLSPHTRQIRPVKRRNRRYRYRRCSRRCIHHCSPSLPHSQTHRQISRHAQSRSQRAYRNDSRCSSQQPKAGKRQRARS